MPSSSPSNNSPACGNAVLLRPPLPQIPYADYKRICARFYFQNNFAVIFSSGIVFSVQPHRTESTRRSDTDNILFPPLFQTMPFTFAEPLNSTLKRTNWLFFCLAAVHIHLLFSIISIIILLFF